MTTHSSNSALKIPIEEPGGGDGKPWSKGWTNIFPKKLKTQRNLVKQQPPHVHRNLKLMDLRVRSAPPIINNDLKA